MKMVWLYALCEPDGEVRYIGVTCQKPRVRYNNHLRVARNGRSDHRCTWIRSLLNKGQKPHLELLYQFPEELRREAEEAFIEYYRQCGFNLVNGTDGGEGWSHGMKHSEETKRKIREANTGRTYTWSEEARANVSRLRRGKPKSEAHRRAISRALKNNPKVKASQAKATKAAALARSKGE